MLLAAAGARRWLGATSPNPPVGAAALDNKGRILAIAAHRKAGEEHAETSLLRQAREQGFLEKIHTLCVTLEPCNHHGRTPPCADAIIAAGIRHVAVGIRDPNPRVAGGGIEKLRQAGMNVTEGVEEETCRRLIYAFAFFARHGRPWITVKRAFDEHGSMIPPPGQKTFAAPESLRLAHRLRKRADAILTGSGTLLADSPAFTVRHVPDHPGKSRILAILDRRRRVPDNDLTRARVNGLTPVIYADMQAALDDLARRGVREVLVEAGPALSQAVLDSGLWTMDVAIHKGRPDRVECRFNPACPPPFNTAIWNWENMLPNETPP
jgi:diaminohydroxyphosphoribosylaminopyrimidine deaminase/5-amino-6-(5-phosphoribosylamino)uracil reductase